METYPVGIAYSWLRNSSVHFPRPSAKSIDVASYSYSVFVLVVLVLTAIQENSLLPIFTAAGHITMVISAAVVVQEVFKEDPEDVVTAIATGSFLAGLVVVGVFNEKVGEFAHFVGALALLAVGLGFATLFVRDVMRGKGLDDPVGVALGLFALLVGGLGVGLRGFGLV